MVALLALTYSVVTVFQFTYVLSRIMITSLGEEGDCRFVGNLLILL